MFKKSCLFVGSTLLAGSLMFGQEGAAPASAEAAVPAAPEYSDAEMLEMLGYSLVYQTGIKDLGFTADDAESIGKGIAQALAYEGSQPSADIMAKMQAFQAFMQPRVMAAQAKAQAAQAEAAAAAEAAAGDNIAAGKAFIESLMAEDDSIQAAESGLHYKITEPVRRRSRAWRIPFWSTTTARVSTVLYLTARLSVASRQPSRSAEWCPVSAKA